MVTGSCYRLPLIYTWRASSSLFCNSCVLSLILATSQLSLFVYDLLQSVGGILSIRWAHDGIITSGPYCTAQGIIKQTGSLGVALTNLVCILYGLFCALMRNLPDTYRSYIHEGSMGGRRRSAPHCFRHGCHHMAFRHTLDWCRQWDSQGLCGTYSRIYFWSSNLCDALLTCSG